MSDKTLVERLHDADNAEKSCAKRYTELLTPTLYRTAADRIEELESALQNIVDTSPANGEDCAYLVAKNALGGSDG